jgi:nucleoid DNA-binding protein
MVLKKSDILEQLAPKPKFSKKQSVVITASPLEWIGSSLGSGNGLLVSGFGKSSAKGNEGQKGRNPTTGKDAILPARGGMTFKRSGKLCEKANQKR